MFSHLLHLGTVTKHRFLVFRLSLIAGIGWQGFIHDLSKFSWAEFYISGKYYTGSSSPTEGERKERGYSSVALHHTGRNKHHFEYWSYYDSVAHRYLTVKIPIKYLKEMACDVIAASMVYHKSGYHDGAPLEYFINKKHKDGFHEESYAIFFSWLELIAKMGHKKALKEIRKVKSY